MRKVFVGVALWLSISLPVSGQGEISLALFNLTPESIDAIGLDGDLLFSMRQTLERSDVIELMSRRRMEEGLYRIDGAQVADTSLVIEYGEGLGVNYILTGTVDTDRSTIIVNFALVDIANRTEAATWQETFLSQSELVSRAPEIAASLENRILTADITPATPIDEPGAAPSSVVNAFTAQATSSRVALNWSISDVGEVFYYNLYRGASASGPFEFVGSPSETRYTDSSIESSGTYYYRIGVVLGTGEELRGGMIAQANVNRTSTSRDITPPVVLSHDTHVNGVSVSFAPSIANKEPARGYQLYVREVGGGWEKATFHADTGEINHTITYVNELSPGTEYDVAVAVVTNSDRESPKSDVVSIKTAPTPVLYPVSSRQTRRVELTWEPPQTDRRMKIFRRETGEPQWQLVAQLNSATSGVYHDTKDLEDGATYEYTATWVDTVSESARADIVAAQTKLLPAPGNVVATGGVKSVTLEWEAVDDDDVTGYRIFRRLGDAKPNDVMDEVATVQDASKTRFVDGVDNDAPLQDGTRYSYIMVALNEFDGRGKPSATSAADTRPRPETPDAPDVASEADAIRVAWEPAPEPEASKYHLYRQWNDGEWQLIRSLDADTTEYVDTDLKPYADTAYQIMVEDEFGLKSDRSAAASVTSPEQIELKVAEQGLLRRAVLNWSEHSNIDGFHIYRRPQGSDQWQRIETIRSAATTEFTDDDRRDLRDGQVYEYTIAAHDDRDETPRSNVVSAAMKSPPPAPAEFRAQDNEVKQVTLSWQPSEDRDVKGYKVYRVKADGDLNLIQTVSQRSTAQYIDNGAFLNKLNDGEEYRYRIAAVNQYDNEGPLSEPTAATTKPVPTTVAGVSAAEEGEQVSISWAANPEADIDHYEIHRGSSCGNVRKAAETNSTRFVDTSVSGERTYCYRVSAIDADNLESELSAGVTITTAPRLETAEQ